MSCSPLLNHLIYFLGINFEISLFFFFFFLFPIEKDFPVSTPPKLTMEQYLAFVDGKPLEHILHPPPASTPEDGTQQEEDALLPTTTTMTADSTSMVIFLDPAGFFPFTPFFSFTLSFLRRARNEQGQVRGMRGGCQHALC